MPALGVAVNAPFPGGAPGIVPAPGGADVVPDIATARPSFLAGAGEMATRIAGLDWAATPIGPIEGWPQSLRTAVSICLRSRFPMLLWWGEQLVMLYNDAYRPILGAAKHPGALGAPGELVWPEIWDVIGPMLASVRQRGEATWSEDQLLALERNGYVEECYFTFSYSPIVDESGGVGGVFTAVTETTDRVLGERRLATLHRLAEELGATQPSDVAACEAALRVLAADPADVPAAVTYLLEPDRDAARRAASYGVDVTHPDVPELISDDGSDRSLWRAIRAGVPLVASGHDSRIPDVVTPVTTAMGTATPNDVLVVPVSVGAGQTPAAVLYLAVSPFRALDREYRAFFELIAGELGAGIADARALQAERDRAAALVELDRAKTEFFTGISHEFRTPLTLIRGPVEELLEAVSDEGGRLDRSRLRAQLATVARNAGRLGRLVDNLLDFSRVQAGRAQARFVAVDLEPVTAGLAGLFMTAIHRAGLDYAVEIDPIGEQVFLDRAMWEKVVLNLLSNALKYTFDGAITVTLRPEDRTAVLAVSDTGTGIAAAELPRLFDRFHRVAGSAGRSAEGSGIGLALVRELVELHGGTVEVTSQVGVGSVFTVRLPLGSGHLPPDQLDVVVDGQQIPQAAPVEPGTSESYVQEALRWLVSGDELVDAPPPAPARPAPSPAVVLVVDDNADMREYLTRLLGGPYTVRVAEDGQAALEAIRAGPPDVVVTDVMMPRMDGFGLLSALRADPHTAGVPVIVLSARAGQESAIEGLTAGADDYLVKPFTAAELLARVRSVLTLAGVRRREANWRAAMLATLQDGFFLVDEEGRVVEINGAFADMFGYGTDALPYPLPHPWWPDPDLDPDDHANAAEVTARLRTTGHGRHLLPLRHRDGHRVWAEISASTVPGPDGVGPPMLIGVARDVTAEHQAAGRDRVLADVGRVLADPGDGTGTLAAVAGLAVGVLGHAALVYLRGDDGRQRPVAAAPDAGAVRSARPGPAALPARYTQVCVAGQPFVLDGRAAGPADGPGDGRSTLLVVPLVNAGAAVGTLSIAAAPDRRFDELDLELAEQFGQRIAAVAAAERVLVRERHVQQLGAALAAAGGASDVVAAVDEGLAAAVDASGRHVYRLVRADTLQLVHGTGRRRTTWWPAAVRIDEEDPVAEVARTGTALWLRDIDAWRARYPDRATAHRSAGEAAAAILPLRVADRTVGVVVASFATARDFAPDERAFMEQLVGQAAQAFERAMLADAQTDIATTLQQHLLPAMPPTLDGVDLATRYLPAVAELAAGGDWYDVLQLDAHRSAIVVGDVVGQGAKAAAVMGQLRSALSLALTTLGPAADPAEALTQLNRYAAHVPGALGSTAVCLIIDTEAGRIRWARAGHPPPLLLPHGGVPRYLEEGGGPLLWAQRPEGVGPFHEQAAADFAPGDTVVLYTDGLVERRGEVIDEGFARLADAAHAAQGAGPAELVDRLLATAVPGGRSHDDIAVVAARALPAPLRRQHAATPEELAVMRRAVGAWAELAGLAATLVDDLQLALGEAAANSVEHAYRDRTSDRPPGRFGYELHRGDGGGVTVAVTDEGRWRPPPADPGYRGRGLEVIRSLAVGMTITHDGDPPGTTVRFTLASPPGPPDGSLPAADDPAASGRPAPVRRSRRAHVRVRAEHGRLGLALYGDVDLAATLTLRPQLLDPLRSFPDLPVRLDLRHTGYLSSAGIGLLLELAERARAGGRSVGVVDDPAGPAARALRVAGVPSTLDIGSGTGGPDKR